LGTLSEREARKLEDLNGSAEKAAPPSEIPVSASTVMVTD
jgi:hypothetical protein